jgi:CheY-like chemotaxis protein
MLIIIVDDDRVFSDPLVWMLEWIGHKVLHCKYVNEVFQGWFELSTSALVRAKRDGVPGEVLCRAAELLAGQRVSNEQDMMAICREHDVWTSLEPYWVKLLPHMQIRPLAQKPDLVLLDVMMPVGDYYDANKVPDSKFTGLRVLRDIIEAVGTVPTVIITVHSEASLHGQLKEPWRRAVKDVIQKPVLPDAAVRRLDAIFPGQFVIPDEWQPL